MGMIAEDIRPVGRQIASLAESGRIAGTYGYCVHTFSKLL